MLLQPRTQIRARGTDRRVSVPLALVAGSLALGLLSLLLPSAPTYDPFAWIIWGREILHLDLNTVEGPSWKPLPVLVTTVTAPFGEASPFLWVAVARAGAIAAIALAGLLAARLAGRAAGFVAAVALALMPWWLRNGALGNSEGIMVALVLGTVLCHLNRRRGWAFALGIGAALLRPEAWPFLGLYALWLWWDERGRLPWLAAGLMSLPVLWLGPEWWGSGNPFRAGERAQTPNPNSPAFAEHPAWEVTKNALAQAPAAATAGAALAVVLGLVVVAGRRRGPRAASRLPGRADAWTALALGALVVAWVALVAAMTVRGFSGNSRYLIVPDALLVVVGAVGAVWAVRALVPASRAVPGVLAAAAVILAAVFVAPDTRALGPTLQGVAYQSTLYRDLGTVIADGGGPAAIKACGRPYTGPFLVPQLAWRLGLHGEQIDLDPARRGSIFHVRTVAPGPVAPPLSDAKPHLLARVGHWALSSDCEAGS